MIDKSRIDPDDVSDVDPWIIPLPEDVSVPTSADAGTPPVLGVVGPGAETPPLPFVSEDEELPTEGFHPRLRRSA